MVAPATSLLTERGFGPILDLMPKALPSLIAAALLIFAGVSWQRQHAENVILKAHVAAWKDSAQRAEVRAQESEVLYETAKALYYAQKPAVVAVTKWKAKVDTVVRNIFVAGDTVDAQATQVLFDSLGADCVRRDSLARAALMHASIALAQQDTVIQFLAHPPKAPGPKRVGAYASGAWDMIGHQAVVQVGVELRLGAVQPFVAAGATLATTSQGVLLVGVRTVF